MFPQPSSFASKGHSIREKIWLVDINLIQIGTDKEINLGKQLTVGNMATISISISMSNMILQVHVIYVYSGADWPSGIPGESPVGRRGWEGPKRRPTPISSRPTPISSRP